MQLIVKGEAKGDRFIAVRCYLFVGRATYLGLAGWRTLIHKSLLPGSNCLTKFLFSELFLGDGEGET